MRIEQFEVILAVAQLHSMRKAAEKMHISVQNVSKIIKDVEHDLNVQIFSRTSYGVFLTSDGKYICSKLEEVVNIIHNLYSTYSLDSEEHKSTAINHVNILSTPSEQETASHLLAQLCNKFCLGKSILDVQDAYSVNESLQKDSTPFPEKYDLMFVSAADTALANIRRKHSNMPIYFLNKYSLGVHISKLSPIAEKSSVSIKEMLKYHLIDHRSDSQTYSLLHMVLDDLGIDIEPKYYMNSVSACKSLVVNNIGYSIVPCLDSLINNLDSSTKIIPLKEQFFITQILLVNPEFVLSPCYNRTINILKHQFKYMLLL